MTDGRIDTTGTHSIDADVVFDLLANCYRRNLLIALLEQRSVDAFDPQIRPETAEAEGRESLEIRAFHVHLPKLEDMEIVEWDREASEVRTGPRFDEIRPLLRSLCDHDELSRDRL